MLIVMTTIDSEEKAEELAKGIVEARLAACVQVLPRMISYFFWEGAVQREAENLLLIKTAEEKYVEVEAYIREHHSYDVPEVVAIRAEQVSEPYAKWLADYLICRD
jgi:periplasmic divalent cation tolerance protein